MHLFRENLSLQFTQFFAFGCMHWHLSGWLKISNGELSGVLYGKKCIIAKRALDQSQRGLLDFIPHIYNFSYTNSVWYLATGQWPGILCQKVLINNKNCLTTKQRWSSDLRKLTIFWPDVIVVWQDLEMLVLLRIQYLSYLGINIIECVTAPQLLLFLLHRKFEKWKCWKQKKALFLFMWWALSRTSGPCHYGSVPALLIPTPLKWPI